MCVSYELNNIKSYASMYNNTCVTLIEHIYCMYMHAVMLCAYARMYVGTANVSYKV